MLQNLIEELQKSIKKHEVEIYKLQNTVTSLESKNLMTVEFGQVQADKNAKTLEDQ